MPQSISEPPREVQQHWLGIAEQTNEGCSMSAKNMRQLIAEVTELKPCPFCGSNAELVDRVGPKFLLKGAFVQCRNKACATAQLITDTCEEAIAIWNSRAPADRNTILEEVARRIRAETINWGGKEQERVNANYFADLVLEMKQEETNECIFDR
jgi:Lar family restriction alleviation protein